MAVRLRASIEQLVVQLFRIRAVDRVDGLADLADIPLEHIAPGGLPLHLLPLAEIRSQLSAAFHQGQLHLLADLIVIGDGFLSIRW